MVKKLLGERLLESKLITIDQLHLALDRQKKNKEMLGKILTDLGFVDEETLVNFLADYFDVPYFHLEEVDYIPPEVVNIIPYEMALAYTLLAISEEGDNLVVAVSDPMDLIGLDNVKRKTGCQIKLVISSETQIKQAMAKFYGREPVKKDEQSGLSASPDLSLKEIKLGDLSIKTYKGPQVSMEQLFEFMVKRNASDLHLAVGQPPQLRINGRLVMTGYTNLSKESIQCLAFSILNKEQIETFRDKRELDISFGIPNLSRFRVNLFWQRNSVGMAVRRIPQIIQDLKELGIPEVIKDFVERPSGLVLVTGSTGQGKSTTLASLIEHVNTHHKRHIITIEDPIEYIHNNKKSIINQREIGKDTLSFPLALKQAFRQDPDIILIGEIRDIESVHAALTLSETGTLIIATLNTKDAVHSISRLIDMFHPNEQHQIRMQLSMSLVGVISQHLALKKDGSGRVLATEIMNCIPAIQNLIRENQIHQIRSFILTGQKHGMHSMNQGLADLYRSGLISIQEAYKNATDVQELATLLEEK